MLFVLMKGTLVQVVFVFVLMKGTLVQVRSVFVLVKGHGKPDNYRILRQTLMIMIIIMKYL